MVSKNWLIRFVPQVLRRNAERAIKFARRIFPRNNRGQFYNLIVVKLRSQPVKKFIANVALGECHSLGILERQAFRLVEQRTFLIAVERLQLFVADAEFAAHGSVNVLSKFAVIDCRHAAIK